MRKQEILKQWKLIFQSSLIFYLGFTILGVIPYVTFEDILWERNLFFVILGAILGVVMFIGFIVMLMMILLSIWPRLRTFDYLYITILLLSLFVVDVMLSDVPALSEQTMAIVFLVITILVIGLQLFARWLMERQKEEELVRLWDKGMDSLPNVDETKKPEMTKMVMTVLVVVVFVALNNFGDLTDRIVTFMVILALGFYVIKLYHQSFKITTKQKIFDFVYFILTYSGVLVILTFLSDFFMMHSVLKALLVLLPFGPFLWVVVPAFYVLLWRDKDRQIKSH